MYSKKSILSGDRKGYFLVQVRGAFKKEIAQNWDFVPTDLNMILCHKNIITKDSSSLSLSVRNIATFWFGFGISPIVSEIIFITSIIFF